MSEHNVSMPGLPDGATVIETGGAGDGVVQGIERSTPSAPAEMGAPQKAAFAEAERLKPAFLAATDSGERDRIALQISECQRAAAGYGPMPAGLVPSDPDAELDTREYDATQAAFEKALAAPVTQDQRDAAVNWAKVQGLDGVDAAAVVGMAEDFGLDMSAAKTLATRTALHVRGGWYGEGAPALTDEDHAELFTESARLAGGEDKLLELNSYARAYVKHIGKQELADKVAGSLAYDLHVLTALAYKAKSLGLEPVTD